MAGGGVWQSSQGTSSPGQWLAGLLFCYEFIMLLTFAWQVNICWTQLLKTSINNSPSSKIHPLVVCKNYKAAEEKTGGRDRQKHETMWDLSGTRLPDASPFPRKDLRENTSLPPSACLKGLWEPSQNILTLTYRIFQYALAEIDFVKGAGEGKRVTVTERHVTHPYITFSTLGHITLERGNYSPEQIPGSP